MSLSGSLVKLGKKNPNYKKGLYIKEKTICPMCHQEYKDKNNKEFIEKIAMCASCDHLESDRGKEEA